MSFYTEMAAVADSLITEFGMAVTVKVPSGSAYNPDTGTVTVTYADQSGYGCVVDFDKDMIDGTKVRIGDKLMLLAPSGVSEPFDGCLVVANSETWTVIPPVNVTSPAGIACLYQVQLRK